MRMTRPAVSKKLRISPIETSKVIIHGAKPRDQARQQTDLVTCEHYTSNPRETLTISLDALAPTML
jgi:hypothetical protein